MAKIPQGILGGIKGRIGGVIGTSWKGINVIKTAPLSVSNPQTAGQVAQRSKFGNAVAFAVLILSIVIKPLWDRFASKQSGFNAFIQANVDYFTLELPSYGSGFAISKGKMASTSIFSTTMHNGNPNVIINWANDSGIGYKLSTDIPFCVLINHSNNTVEAFEGSTIRSDSEMDFDLATTPVLNDSIDIYLAFRRADGTIVSNSSSFHLVVPA
jgi:hypothetical protein